ncbi:MAG: restriction endonuclease-like protein [Lachnospiraceae bacterium]|nr:restriction endonuclease-like protein [Lachnospiraceae bacterium]
MTLPPIGCNQIVDVSTENIRVTIKRRKKPSLTSDALLQQESKLEIWGDIKQLKIGNEICDDSIGADYTHISVAPLFFEQSDYIVNARALNGSTLHFEHADKNVREALSVPFDDASMLSGTINFGSEVGYSNLIFRDEQGNKLLMEIEIFPSKLSYKEDYEAIRNDINEMVEAAAIDFINSTFALGTISASKNDVPAIFFSLINQLFGKYYKAVNAIMSKPNHKLVTEHETIPAHKIRKMDSATYQWIEKHPERAKRTDGKICVNGAPAVKKRITYDTIENRLVKFMLSTTVKKLSKFRRNYLIGFRDPEIIGRIDSMISRINRQLKNPVFEEVSQLKDINTMSLVFQMAPGYRDLYKYFQLIQRGISFSGEIYSFSMKDTAKLYEYWCFIKLVNIMKTKYTFIDDGKDIIKANRKGVTVTLSKDSKSVVKFIDTKTGDKFKLIYNPGAYPSDTVKQVPDNVLSLEKSTNSEGKTAGYQYIFDAKYKVEMNPDEYYPDVSPGPKVTDINTMHRYRDAIVSTEGKRNEKLMFGAYVLFPYPNSEEEYRKHHFYESIEKVNIGGIPFLPKKTEIAEELLTRLVGESDASAFERSILPKGIEERLEKTDWNKRDVLVGTLSSKEQMKEVLAGNYYYVPIKNMPNKKGQAGYVALYQSQRLYGKEAGILYYGEIIQTVIKLRKNINKLPGRTGPKERCYVFTVKEWEMLDYRIEYEAEWVYKPRFTNLFLLQNCRKTFELFNIRSAEDYRLVSELRRIQKNIQVQDNPKDLFVRFNESISVYNDEDYIYVFVDGKLMLKRSTKSFAEHPSQVFRDIQKLID